LTLSFVKDLSIIIAGGVGLITFMMGVAQLRAQVRQARTEHFVQMRRRFLENEVFRGLLELIARDDASIVRTRIQDRRNLVGFFEEVGLLVQSGSIRIEVAHYMFGYYVSLIDQCEAFWEDLDRESDYWTVFRNFSAELRTTSALHPDKAGDLKL